MFRRIWLKNALNYTSNPREDSEAQYFVHKRLTFLIGKNNSGKSRFLRSLFEAQAEQKGNLFTAIDLPLLDKVIAQSQDLQYPNHHTSFEKLNLKISSYHINGFPIPNKVPSIGYPSNADNDDRKMIYECKTIGVRSQIDQESEKFVRDLQNGIEKQIEDYLLKKIDAAFYIPILRGLRPVQPKKEDTPYIDRTIKDYFPRANANLINNKNIVTGECFYHELMRDLLGEPEGRERIRKYEELLGQYFFDNRIISLIPKYNDDVVFIKIGDDPQYPIHQLGDGLQQAIILTYECFIQDEAIHAFFIEEPELHMHAGMLRQLMNFYLNETKHYYFFTTHSNHLLDMVDESDEVVIQKFNKIKKDDHYIFEIKRCDKDRDLLSSLGVRPSSVYLANCTIWVEGITDRLYLSKYLNKYLELLKKNDYPKYTEYRKFMPNYHYTFVEYQGSNLAHWNFSENYQDQANNRGLNAKAVCSDMLLIADGDINGKGDRVKVLEQELDSRFHLLKCKEIENTLPTNLIIKAVQTKFSGMKTDTKTGFDISQLDNLPLQDIFYKNKGVGAIIDDLIRVKGEPKSKRAFSEPSGTIRDKLVFCKLILSSMESDEWELTDSAINLCERVFKHIKEMNDS